MKINKKFAPITIEIETEEELRNLKQIAYDTYAAEWKAGRSPLGRIREDSLGIFAKKILDI